VTKNEYNDDNQKAKRISTEFEQLKPRVANNTPKSFIPHKLQYKVQKEDDIYNHSPVKDRPLKAKKDFVSIQRHEDILDHMKTEQKMIMKVNKEMHKKLQEANK